MEYKLTQQDVYINDVVFDESVEQPIDTEFSLPDYCPDVARVLKCRINPRIGSRSINGGILTVEGTAYINLIYVDEEKGDIRSHEHSVGFTRNFEVPGEYDNAQPIVRAKMEYCNCRPINQRKISVHGALSLRLKVCARRKKEIITDVDGEGIEVLRGEVPASSTLSTAEKYLLISDELDIGPSQQGIRYLLRGDARAIALDCKVVSNKVIVKGELLVSAFYCGDEDGGTDNLDTSLPISQIIDIDGVNEKCTCSASIDVVSLDLKPRTGLNGEARSMAISSKLLIMIKAYCENDVPVIYDIYSTQFESSNEKYEIPFEKKVGSVNENYLCKKTIDLPEKAMDSVADLWCDSAVEGVRQENNQVVISGTVMICILGKDKDDLPSYFESPVAYEYRYNLDSVPEKVSCDPEVVAANATYTLLPTNEIEVRVELDIKAEILSRTGVSALVGTNIHEDKPKEKDAAALIIYYADADETVWDIARAHNTSAEQVMNLNTLQSSGKLGAKKMLMIPTV
ncbi:MAG TPA: hypothetical protein DEQ02_00075 [Ruminococcaceae bacterium]|nr:hypothetical protein [Oscillospiraceae bacterium]